jgi:phage terminase large subunit-like protein
MAIHPIDAYPAAVLSGAIPAGRYARLACARHERDRAREGSPGFPYVVHVPEVDRFVRFASRLRHYKGEWAGTFIDLQPFQIFSLGSILGWIDTRTGLRRFRNSYLEIPRKNGKSLMAALMSLYVTFFDEEPGAEGYVAATKRDQALIVFNDAKRLVRASNLRARIQVLVRNLSRDVLAQKLTPLGADEDSMDGLNAHFVNLDELHAMKTRGVIDVLEGSTGARRQPLVFKITTAGSDPQSPCGHEHAYACAVLDEQITDETYFAFIAHADPEDDWKSEAAARKANPNYGVSVSPGDLAAKRIKAAGIPSAAAAYQQKHLNWWVHAEHPWLSLDGWRAGQEAARPLDAYVGRWCVVGIDLASKLDLCALVAVFPPVDGIDLRWRVVPFLWTPRTTAADRADRDRAPYLTWIDAGHVIGVDGTRVDHGVIRGALDELRAAGIAIRAIGFDPWHAEQLEIQLVQEDGFAAEQVVEVSQTFAGMSSGCKALEADVLAGRVDGGGSPVVEWCVGNAVVARDNKDNIYPTKRRSRGRIDPVVAMAIAWNLAARQRDEAPAEEPDLVVV